jgi:hypothetical protein
LDEEVNSEELPQGWIPVPKNVSLSLPLEQPFRLVRFRRFSFEALVPSMVAQAPSVTAEHHPLMGFT